jgi:hypothetical protein
MADASYILEEKPIDVFTLHSRGSRTVETATSAASSGVESLGTSSNARKVPARFEGDLAFPRYFVCPRPYVARPNDAFHYNAANSAAYRSAPHSLVIGPSFQRADPGTGESLINDHGPTIYLLDVKQKAKRFGGILVCARDEPEGRICMVGHRETETCISAEYSRFCFTAKVKTQLRLAHLLCDCRWNRWAWEVVGFE